MNISSPVNQSAFQFLSQKIGDYLGYEKTIQRMQSDLKLRQHLVKKIKGLLQDLLAVPKAAQEKDQERLDSLLESTIRNLKTICQSLENPTYNGTAFFVIEKLPEKRLARIYQFENGMLAELSNLSDEISALKGQSWEKEKFEDYFLHIHDFVDNINQALFGREALVLGDE
jgi:hypothetical protein